MKTSALALLLATTLAGCATKYQQSGFSGGFADLRLDENVFKVTFNGNGFTSAARVEEMALLRAAELTLAAGCEFFVIASSQASVQQIQQQTPSSVSTSGFVVGNHYYANSAIMPGVNYTISKPSKDMVIVTFKERPTVGLPFSAKLIVNSLAPKYKRR
jgi:outer membrane protein assembly factor BamE (lipoprotein component of BamABCDE complex)